LADALLRALERAARADPDDLDVWTRYVRALGQARRDPPEDLSEQHKRMRAALGGALSPELATIGEGDEVWVDEVDTAWIVGRWRGIVTARYVEQDDARSRPYVRFRVRPTNMADDDTNPLPWRVRPLPQHRVFGVQLSRHDRLELIARDVDPGPFPK